MMASPALSRKREKTPDIVEMYRVIYPLIPVWDGNRIVGIRANPSLDSLDERAEFLRVSGGICNGGFEK